MRDDRRRHDTAHQCLKRQQQMLRILTRMSGLTPWGPVLLGRKRPSRQVRPLLEELENRTLLATFTVNSTDDDGDANLSDARCDTGKKVGDVVPACTLRAAIEEANATALKDTIQFAIPFGCDHDTDVCTIRPGVNFGTLSGGGFTGTITIGLPKIIF